MTKALTCVGLGVAGLCALAFLAPVRAAAQDPILTPVIVGETAPIVVKAVTPKAKPGTQKFQGYVINANSVQVTVRARDNAMKIQTFTLNETTAAKMQKIIDKGGYQHGDKITVYYDTRTQKALKFKGKPSRPL